MPYTIGPDGYLDFSRCTNDDEKIDQCWDYYREHLADVDIVAADGKSVRGFTEETFTHIISGSSNRFDPALDHDIDFVEHRARALPLIAKAISGALTSRVYRISHDRYGKTVVRRNLVVIEVGYEYFVVVLDELKGKYRIRTAFPSSEDYVNKRIRALGISAGIWGEQSEMPRIPGSEAGRVINSR